MVSVSLAKKRSTKCLVVTPLNIRKGKQKLHINIQSNKFGKKREDKLISIATIVNRRSLLHAILECGKDDREYVRATIDEIKVLLQKAETLLASLS